MLKFFRLYGLSIAVAMTILWLCITPNPPKVENAPSNMDKVVHAMMYLFLTAIICRDLFKNYVDFDTLKMVMWSIVFTFIFGALIEFLQEYCTINRTGDLIDWIADASGSVIGYFLCRYFYPRYLNRD